MRIKWSRVTRYAKFPAVIVLLILAAVLLAAGGFLCARVWRTAPQAPRAADAAMTSEELQNLFSYQGRPIHPFCVDFTNGPYDLDDSQNPIPLATCSKTTSTTTIEDGNVRADYPRDAITNSYAGYASYRVLAKEENRFLLSVDVNGGGTGMFSSLSWFELKGNGITHLSSIVGGDRCNGGVTSDATVQNGILSYSVNATPPDMVELAAPGTVGFHDQGDYLIEPYADLEASAESCFAFFNYQYDMKTGTSTLKTITLVQWGDPTLKAGDGEDPNWISQFTYQSCFNEIYNSYMDRGKTELTLADLKQFVNRFFTQCGVKN